MTIDGEVARIQRLTEIMTLHSRSLSAGLIIIITGLPIFGVFMGLFKRTLSRLTGNEVLVGKYEGTAGNSNGLMQGV